jgi:hypothetical protein
MENHLSLTGFLHPGFREIAALGFMNIDRRTKYEQVDWGGFQLFSVEMRESIAKLERN